MKYVNVWFGLFFINMFEVDNMVKWPGFINGNFVIIEVNKNSGMVIHDKFAFYICFAVAITPN